MFNGLQDLLTCLLVTTTSGDTPKARCMSVALKLLLAILKQNIREETATVPVEMTVSNEEFVPEYNNV